MDAPHTSTSSQKDAPAPASAGSKMGPLVLPDPLDDLLPDRRRSMRKPVTAKGFLSINALEEDEGHLVTVHDLSLEGVGFRCPAPLLVGDSHAIIVMAGPLRLSSRIRIAFCRQGEDGLYDVGAEFC